MHELDDHELLRQYAQYNSEAAFAALVARHVDKVYSAALRHTRNAHTAEEITQAVFVILARKSGRLGANVILAAWLYETARLTAVTFIRSEIRRARREQEAHMQTDLNENDDDSWPRIAPLLDDALSGLSAVDRHAVVLRYFDGQSLGEVGAVLGVSEDAAKKRVTRAVEKLRGWFTKRGVTLTATVLTAAISANSVQAAPLGLAVTVTATAVKGAAVSGSTLILIKGALKIMAWTKAKTAIVIGTGLLLAAGTISITVKEVVSHRGEVWQRNYDPSLLDGVPRQTRIVPALNSRNPGVDIWGGRNGKLVGLGVASVSIVQAAYDITVGRMIFSVPLPEGRYDFISTQPSGRQAALQEAVKKQFGLVGKRELIQTNVLALTVRSRNVPGLNPNSDPTSQNYSRNNDTIQCVYAPISKLVEFLENALGTPVVDRTGLNGHFDMYVKWDSTPEGLKKAVLEQMGLELVPSRGSIEYLVVEKAN